MKSPQSSLLVVLLCLALAASYYKVIPYFSSTTDSIISSIESHLHSLSPPSFCTKEIGEGVCCDLHLGAEPCLDDCRQQFVDRVSFQLTNEYEECADQCLIMYRASCGKENVLKERKQLWDGEMQHEVPGPNPRRRRYD